MSQLHSQQCESEESMSRRVQTEWETIHSRVQQWASDFLPFHGALPPFRCHISPAVLAPLAGLGEEEIHSGSAFYTDGDSAGKVYRNSLPELMCSALLLGQHFYSSPNGNYAPWWHMCGLWVGMSSHMIILADRTMVVLRYRAGKAVLTCGLSSVLVVLRTVVATTLRHTRWLHCISPVCVGPRRRQTCFSVFMPVTRWCVTQLLRIDKPSETAALSLVRKYQALFSAAGTRLRSSVTFVLLVPDDTFSDCFEQINCFALSSVCHTLLRLQYFLYCASIVLFFSLYLILLFLVC